MATNQSIACAVVMADGSINAVVMAEPNHLVPEGASLLVAIPPEIEGAVIPGTCTYDAATNTFVIPPPPALKAVFTIFNSYPAAKQRVTLFKFNRGQGTRPSRYIYQRANIAIKGDFQIHKIDGTITILKEGDFVPEWDLSDPNRGYCITALTDGSVLMQIAFPGEVDFAKEFLEANMEPVRCAGF